MDWEEWIMEGILLYRRVSTKEDIKMEFRK
jgi:hypothetical protein